MYLLVKQSKNEIKHMITKFLFCQGRASKPSPQITIYYCKLMMDREAWWAAVHRVTKGWARLSDWTELTSIIQEKKEHYKAKVQADSVK